MVDNSVTIAIVLLLSHNYFNTSCSLLPEHLEWLSIACPNLQRLDLSGNARCLSDLQGLHGVATNYRNLQYLNLTGIDGKNIHPEIYALTLDLCELWEISILCTMHLTELSVEA